METSQLNKNISVWRGVEPPPTIYHLWIKNSTAYLNIDNLWVPITFNFGKTEGTMYPGEDGEALESELENILTYLNNHSVINSSGENLEKHKIQYLSESEYNTLVENNKIDSDTQYNVYEDIE